LELDTTALGVDHGLNERLKSGLANAPSRTKHELSAGEILQSMWCGSDEEGKNLDEGVYGSETQTNSALTA
jgi:hypothetical protein